MKHLVQITLAAALLALSACSAPQVDVDDTPVVTQPPAPQCLAGCMLASSGACQVTANSMDQTTVSQETIPCDPVCCQGGANGGKSGDPNDPDGDGIVGDADQCPDQPEDFDEFEDKNGCPDPDNDQDGIPDTDDVCQYDPETKNGFEDRDGCPDQAPPPPTEE